MVSKTSKAKQAVPLSAFGAEIAARKAALGLSDPPRNAGANRTESKKALLKAIDAAAAAKGFKW